MSFPGSTNTQVRIDSNLKVIPVVDSHTVVLWNAQTGSVIFTFEGHSDSIRQVGFTPGNRHIFSASEDGSVRVWDIDSQEEISQVPYSADRLSVIALSPDGDKFLAAGTAATEIQGQTESGSMTLRDLSTGDVLREFSGQFGKVSAAAFNPDGSRILTGDSDGIALLWDANSGEVEQRFVGHQGPIRGVAFIPNSDDVMTISDDGTGRIWDSRSGAGDPPVDDTW